MAIAVVIGLFILNYYNIHRLSAYLILGVLLWYCLGNVGIHETIAGVVLGFCIPLRGRHALLKKLELKLHPWIAYGILPLFAFLNAGFPLVDMTTANIFNRLSIGIICSLFIGKQIGVFLSAWIAVKMKVAQLPNRIRWSELYGVGILCGIGFTMSLYFDTLAFSGSAIQLHYTTNLAIVVGSLLSALFGYFFLRKISR